MVWERKSSRARLTQIADLARPVSLAEDKTLPVLPALRPLLPGGELQRGYSLVVEGSPGANSLAQALSAGPSQSGSWGAAVGMPAFGVASAAEVGVALERLILIAPPSPKLWPSVCAALVDAFDLVLVHWPGISGHMARRLGHRVRDRGSVLISILPSGSSVAWNEAADLRIRVVEARWKGLEWGHGRLQSRHMVVETAGRRSVVPKRTSLWLPDPSGKVAASDIDSVEQLSSQPVFSATSSG